MRLGFICASFLTALALLFPGSAVCAAADNGKLKIESQLVWGTNDPKPATGLRLVGPKMSARLKSSPFKWDHYYEVNRQTNSVTLNGETRVKMSKNCEISITNLGDSQLRCRLFGHGVLVSDVTQALPKGELLVIGGDAENATAWFVILRQPE